MLELLGLHSGFTQMSGESSHERTFQSREIIWNTFESLARELDVPIDDLVNDAMEAYARVRGYAIAAPEAPTSEISAVDGDVTPRRNVRHPSLAGRPNASRHNPMEETYDAPALSPLDRSYSPARAPADFDDDDLAKTATRGALVRPRGDPRVAPPPRPMGPPPLSQKLIPSTTLPMPGAPTREAAATRRLVLTYQGRAHDVEKERYLIGRSKTQADLRLDDPNVSRQHAVIERVGAAWYIVDLGSTNGVHVAGERVARRALTDGDVIVITSHEIRCALR